MQYKVRMKMFTNPVQVENQIVKYDGAAVTPLSGRNLRGAGR
jgi:hypothetical protein